MSTSRKTIRIEDVDAALLAEQIGHLAEVQEMLRKGGSLQAREQWAESIEGLLNMLAARLDTPKLPALAALEALTNCIEEWADANDHSELVNMKAMVAARKAIIAERNMRR